MVKVNFEDRLPRSWYHWQYLLLGIRTWKIFHSGEFYSYFSLSSYHWKWTSRLLCSMKWVICCWAPAVILLQDQQWRDRRFGGIFRRSRQRSGPILRNKLFRMLDSYTLLRSPVALIESHKLQGRKWVVRENFIEEFVRETADKLEVDTPGTTLTVLVEKNSTLLLQFWAAEKLPEHTLGDVPQSRVENAQFLQVCKCADINHYVSWL